MKGKIRRRKEIKSNFLASQNVRSYHMQSPKKAASYILKCKSLLFAQIYYKSKLFLILETETKEKL